MYESVSSCRQLTLSFDHEPIRFEDSPTAILPSKTQNSAIAMSALGQKQTCAVH